MNEIKELIKDLDSESAERALKGAFKNIYNNCLYTACKELFQFKDVNWRTHGRVITTLQSPSKRKLICIPRGCLKSTITSVAFPIWCLNRNPNLRILLDSELYTNSKNFLREIKGYLESDALVDLYGPYKSNTWNEGEIIIKQRTKVLKEASLTAAGIGTTKVGQHFDIIVGDDYNSQNNTNTPENAQKVISHYKYNISILEPDGIYVIVGTRYSELDLIGHVLEHEVKNRGENTIDMGLLTQRA
jgi:hypothetical protein